MSDTRYFLRHADGDIALDGCLSAIPEVDPGETVTLEFIIRERPYDEPLTISTGGTAGGPAGFTAGGPVGATVSQLAPFQLPGQSYRRLISFADYAGAAAYGEAEFGVPFFREKLPADAPKETLLVKVEPGADIEGAPTLWGLVEGINDQTVRGDSYRVGVDLFVLGDTTQYSDEQTVRSALEESV